MCYFYLGFEFGTAGNGNSRLLDTSAPRSTGMVIQAFKLVHARFALCYSYPTATDYSNEGHFRKKRTESTLVAEYVALF
jgi:hypothetical protein